MAKYGSDGEKKYKQKQKWGDRDDADNQPINTIRNTNTNSSANTNTRTIQLQIQIQTQIQVQLETAG